MRCDSQASLLAHNFASPCLGHEPKAKVATTILDISHRIWKLMSCCQYLGRWKATMIKTQWSFKSLNPKVKKSKRWHINCCMNLKCLKSKKIKYQTCNKSSHQFEIKKWDQLKLPIKLWATWKNNKYCKIIIIIIKELESKKKSLQTWEPCS
jgi:hypothetical protein